MNSKLSIGDTVSFEKKFTSEEHLAHLRCINDTNPIHIDEDFAAKTPFKKPIVQGALTSALFSGILGTSLPGKDTVYLGQNIKFVKPIFLDETVIAKVTVIDIREDKPIVRLSTQLFNEAGELAIDGEAVVKVPKSRT